MQLDHTLSIDSQICRYWPYARMTYLLHFRRPERGERLKQWITGRYVYGEFVWPKLVFKLKIAINCWLRLAQLSTVARSILWLCSHIAASCLAIINTSM
jgi:hypothetical protein